MLAKCACTRELTVWCQHGENGLTCGYNLRLVQRIMHVNIAYESLMDAEADFAIKSQVSSVDLVDLPCNQLNDPDRLLPV